MDDQAKIRAVLQHLDCGRDLEEFPGTRNEKLVLIGRVTKRRLVEWEKARGRYRLTSSGRRQLGDGRLARASRFSVKVIAPTLAAATIAGFWFWAQASHLPVGGPAAPVQLARIEAAPRPLSLPSDPADIGPAYSIDHPRVADRPSSAVAITSLEQPNAAEHPTEVAPAAPVRKDGGKSATQPGKKIAKSRHNATHASRRRKDGPGSTLAYTEAWQQPQYFGYGGGGVQFRFR